MQSKQELTVLEKQPHTWKTLLFGRGTVQNIFDGKSISNDRENSKRNRTKGVFKGLIMISPFLIIGAAVLLAPLSISLFAGLGIVILGGAVASYVLRKIFPSIGKTIEDRRNDLIDSAKTRVGLLVKKLNKTKNDLLIKVDKYRESAGSAKGLKKKSFVITVLFAVGTVAALAFAPVLFLPLLAITGITGTIGLGALGLQKWSELRQNKNS